MLAGAHGLHRRGEPVTAISDGDPALVRSAMGGLCAPEPPPSALPDQARIVVEQLRHLL